jgi:hypothetical protein
MSKEERKQRLYQTIKAVQALIKVLKKRSE